MPRPIPAIPMPLTLADLWAAAWAGADAPAALEEACRRYHGAQACFAISSARAGLWVALRALRKLHPQRSEVVLPAYTCPTVGRAVLASGAQGLCADVSAEDFNIAPDAVAGLVGPSTLAVVAAHMFGTPCDLPRLQGICRAAGATLIEDAAQACGARFAGQVVGSFGALAVLSLGRSKNLRGHKGGLVVVNEANLVEAVTDEVAQLPILGPCDPYGLAQQAAICLLGHPRAWHMAKRLPGMRIGAEDQSFDKEPSRLRPWQAVLGSRAFGRLDQYNGLRRQLGRYAEGLLRDLDWVQVQAKDPPRESAYVRLALRVKGSHELRDAVETRLQAQGIDARAFYTRPMYAYEWWTPSDRQGRCPHAEELVAGNLTLPLFCGTKETDVQAMVRQLETARP